MNTNDWQQSEARRKDLMTAAERHQMAEAMQTNHPLKQKLGEWLVRTGENLIDKEEIRTGVRTSRA